MEKKNLSLPWKGLKNALTNASFRPPDPADNSSDADAIFLKLREKANELLKSEPYMTNLLKRTILHRNASNGFNTTISLVIASRLIASCGNPFLCTKETTNIIEDAMNSQDLEYGHTMQSAVVKDILACTQRDPACKTELEVVLFYKGFAALVCHRAARRHCSRKNGRFVSLWLQSQASAAFGVDIHPAAEIGAGVFFDHATGLVIGETAKVGNMCTILHGVTLGGTGKADGDRHPKIGDDVLIGAGTSILGNIKIGNGAKIGAGSIVLKPIPHGATAVGAPAKIIGWAKESHPGSVVDTSLSNIVTIGEKGEVSDVTNSTTSSEESVIKSNDKGVDGIKAQVLASTNSSASLSESEESANKSNDIGFDGIKDKVLASTNSSPSLSESKESAIKSNDKGVDGIKAKVLASANSSVSLSELEESATRSHDEDVDGIKAKVLASTNSSISLAESEESATRNNDKDVDSSKARSLASTNSFASSAESANSSSNKDDVGQTTRRGQMRITLPAKYSMCMFRGNCSKLASGRLTYSDFNDNLSDFCTEDEIGEVYLSLLKKDPSKGNISKRDVKKHFADSAQEYTRLSKQQCEERQKSLLFHANCHQH